MKLTWKQFRELTADIPDDDEVYFNIEGKDLIVDVDLTKRNFTNDNTVILDYDMTKIVKPKEHWAGSLFDM